MCFFLNIYEYSRKNSDAFLHKLMPLKRYMHVLVLVPIGDQVHFAIGGHPGRLRL